MPAHLDTIGLIATILAVIFAFAAWRNSVIRRRQEKAAKKQEEPPPILIQPLPDQPAQPAGPVRPPSSTRMTPAAPLFRRVRANGDIEVLDDVQDPHNQTYVWE